MEVAAHFLESTLQTAWNKGIKKSVCKFGHQFTPENTYMTKSGAQQCKTCRRKLARIDGQRLKRKVIAGYGGKCNWDGCEIRDPDMLSLDHVNNDGAAQKKILGARITRDGRVGGLGGTIYRQAIKDNFPPEYQVLCANHQIKKEIIRRRENATTS